MKISKMSEFIDIEREKKVLLIDYHNLVYRNLHVAFYKYPEDTEFIYWKYLVVNSLFAALKQFNPTRVVLAIDDKNSWRKKIYPEYKAQRKESKDKSKIDFNKFYQVLNIFTDSLKDTFTNIYCLTLNETEGDDIVAVLCKEEMQDYKKIILSNDNDYLQLLKFKNVKVYNPNKKSFVEGLNPQVVLEIKILSGDDSDNIKPVRPKIGEKTAIKIIEKGLDEFIKSKKLTEDEVNNLNDKYKINKQIVDFEFIPSEIRKNILKKFQEYKIKKLHAMNIMNWLASHRMMKFNEDLQTYYPYLNKLE